MYAGIRNGASSYAQHLITVLVEASRKANGTAILLINYCKNVFIEKAQVLQNQYSGFNMPVALISGIVLILVYVHSIALHVSHDLDIH